LHWDERSTSQNGARRQIRTTDSFATYPFVNLSVRNNRVVCTNRAYYHGINKKCIVAEAELPFTSEFIVELVIGVNFFGHFK